MDGPTQSGEACDLSVLPTATSKNPAAFHETLGSGRSPCPVVGRMARRGRQRWSPAPTPEAKNKRACERAPAWASGPFLGMPLPHAGTTRLRYPGMSSCPTSCATALRLTPQVRPPPLAGPSCGMDGLMAGGPNLPCNDNEGCDKLLVAGVARWRIRLATEGGKVDLRCDGLMRPSPPTEKCQPWTCTYDTTQAPPLSQNVGRHHPSSGEHAMPRLNSPSSPGSGTPDLLHRSGLCANRAGIQSGT